MGGVLELGYFKGVEHFSEVLRIFAEIKTFSSVGVEAFS